MCLLFAVFSQLQCKVFTLDSTLPLLLLLVDRLSWTLINRMRVQFSQCLRSTTERRSQLELHFAGSSDVSNLQ